MDCRNRDKEKYILTSEMPNAEVKTNNTSFDRSIIAIPYCFTLDFQQNYLENKIWGYIFDKSEYKITRSFSRPLMLSRNFKVYTTSRSKVNRSHYTTYVSMYGTCVTKPQSETCELSDPVAFNVEQW